MGVPGKATKTRLEYREYINSPAWRKKREDYWRSGMPKNCYCCGTPRHSGMHLHHRTYKNLGNERLMDLAPMCQTCHERIHDLHRSSERWKMKGLWAATKQIRKLNKASGKLLDR